MPVDCFVFDTNVLISAQLFNGSIPSSAYEKALNLGLVLRSHETFEEFAAVLLRTKFNKLLPFSRRIELIEEFKRVSLEVVADIPINACRDPKDNKFLELAVAAEASVIITGDKDLLILHPFQNIPIVSPADFLTRF